MFAHFSSLKRLFVTVMLLGLLFAAPTNASHVQPKAPPAPTSWLPLLMKGDDGSAYAMPWCPSFRATRYAGGAPLMTVFGEPLKAGDPYVFYDEEAGKFKMWFTIYRQGILGIGYAESSDGRVWDPEVPGTLPHVLQPTPGGWDRDGLETISVLKKDGKYWMWYLGYPCDRPEGERGRFKCIGLATSDDGIHWVKHPEPVLKPTQPWEQPYLRTYVENGEKFQAWDGGVHEPSVLWDADEQVFKMWYNGYTLETVTVIENGEQITRDVRVRQIGYATSPDGIHWTKYPGNPVFRPLRTTSTWEEAFAVDHTNVIADPVRGYHLFYFSQFSIGHAYSPDGIHWERDENNPLVPYQPDTGNGARMYQGPSAVPRGDTIWLYYAQSPPGARDWQEATRLGREAGLAIVRCEEPVGDILSRPVLGEQKILFIPVYYPGEEEPLLTAEGARQVAEIVRQGLESNSYGRATFTIDVTPLLPMPQPVSYYQNGPTLVRVRTDALEMARREGFTVENYDREVIISPKIWPYATGQGTLNGHTALVGCGWCPYLVLHELGHSFGWMHANFWRVTGGSPIAPNGEEVEYGDPFDIMGDQLQGRPRAFHHYNPWFKARAGWIPPVNILEVTQAGVYTVTIRALERAPQQGSEVTEYTAVRIPRNPHQDYWLFYRAEEPEANDGLILTWGARSNIPASILLDMTPGSQEDWQDVELGVDELFYDPEAGVEVRVLEKTPDALRVRVIVQPRTLDRLPVIDVLSPGGDRVVSGAVRYEATAYDPDAGSANGASIATVTLYLHPLDDPLIAAVRAGQEPPNPVATATFSRPPYLLEVQTDEDAPAIPDGIYALVVTAVSEDGGSNTVWYPHIIDNTGPSEPEGPVCRFPSRFTHHPQGAPLKTATGEPLAGWDPSVLYDEERGLYRVWYTLYENNLLGIAYAESRDGLTWTRVQPDGRPHILTPTPGTWDADGMETVSVLKKDGTYWMWYYGYPCDRQAGERGRVRCIGAATSDDGLHWVKHPEPVLKPTAPWEQPFLRTYVENGQEIQAWDGGVEEPTVVWDAADGLFKMWYSASTLEEVTFVEHGELVTREARVYQIGYATSPDGIHWTKHSDNPVFRALLDRNDTGWESSVTVSHSNVLPDPAGGYHLFYFSGYAIGHAYSSDGIHWTRNPNNPMVPAQVTEEQFLAFGGPSALFSDDTIRLYLMRSVPGATRWREGGMHLGLATAPCEGGTSTAVTVTVDLTQALPDTPSMAGFLHGQRDDVPPLEVVSALAPRLIRGAPPSLARAQALGARYHLLLSNVWGYPPQEDDAGGHRQGEAGVQQRPCTPSLDNWRNIGPPYEHFDCFREAILQLITDELQDVPLDGSFIFDIWNEPNVLLFWVGTEEQFFETFAVAVETLRSLLPGAWIAGPSTGIYDPEFLRRLLDYAVANGIRFDVLTWHELLVPGTAHHRGANISQVQQHLEEARRLFLEDPRYEQVGLRELHINEYVGRDDQYRPGELVAYLSALELGGADAAAHSCWPAHNGLKNCFNNSLDGLVEPDAWRPRPKWWVYRVYAEGVPGRVASSSTNPAIVPLASLSADPNAVTVLLGHTRRIEGPEPAALPVELQLNGLPPAFTAGAVVTVRHMPNQGEQVLPDPPTVLTATMTIQDGRGSLFLGSLPLHDAWEVRAVPVRRSPPVLENDCLRLEFDQQAGSDQAAGLALQHVTVKPTGYTPSTGSGQSFSFDPGDLWAITLRATDGTTTLLSPSTTTYTLSVITSSTDPTQTLTAVWDNITPTGSNIIATQPSSIVRRPSSIVVPGLTVTATITLGPDAPYALWTVAVDNRYPDQAVYHVDFPRLKIQLVGRPETNRAAVPYLGGRLIYDPINSYALKSLWNLPPFFPYPRQNASLQLFTYFDTADGHALYLAAHDGAGYTKAFDFRSDGQRLHFGVRQFPEYNITPGNDYVSPYPVAIGALPGDWYDAAKAYRAWALGQPWAQRDPIVFSDDFSAKLKGSDIMGVWHPIADTVRPFEAVAQDMERWADFLGIDHVSGVWYEWHGNEFDTGWPEYEPVEPSFADGMTLTHHLDNYAWPYIDPTVWDTATASYTATHAADYTMKDELGRVQTFTSTKGAVFALMDPATPFWQEYVRGWVLELQRRFNVDGLYLDVWSGTGYGFDYDPTHGHPTGGGNYIAQGMRTQGRMIREATRANDPEFIMMSEHPGELFIDLLELVYVEYLGPLNSMQWWTLPLFNTVYHDYIMMPTFINTSSKLPESPLNEDALSYMWAVRYAQGNLLAVNGDKAPVLQDPVESTPNYPAYAFLKQLVQSYAYAAPYLRYGERLRDLPVQARTRPAPSAKLSPSGSAQQFALAPYGPAQPVVLSSAWRSVTDPSTGSGHRDSVGLVFTNWVTTTETITYTFDPGRYGLPALGPVSIPRHLGLYRLDANGPHLLTSFTGTITRTETLPARSLLVLMVAPCPHPYDFSANGVVDVGDMMTVTANWHAADPDPRADLDGGGEVNMVDVMRVAAEWGAACPDLAGDRDVILMTPSYADTTSAVKAYLART